MSGLAGTVKRLEERVEELGEARRVRTAFVGEDGLVEGEGVTPEELQRLHPEAAWIFCTWDWDGTETARRAGS